MTELVRLPDDRPVRTMTANEALKAKVETLQWKRVEFFKLDIGEGVQVDGWRILPPDFELAKKYPLFVYVYGELASQTVQDNWGGSGYLWHLMLAQQGYVISSFNNRGTPTSCGRTWRKSSYCQIGILASRDQAAAVKAVLAAWGRISTPSVSVSGAGAAEAR